MSNIKLQVGEDYLTEIGHKEHIEKFDSVTGHYIGRNGARFLNNGKCVFWNINAQKYELSGHIWDIISYVPKVNKEPSDEEIDKAGSKWFSNQLSTTNKKGKAIISAQATWKAAIEWYKQQIK